MAPAIDSISKRLATSADAGYDVSNKLYRVIQFLPSAAFEYGYFASQVLYLAANLEQINGILPNLQLADGSQVLKDIGRLLDFSDDAYIGVKEALPQRPFDGADVDLLLPFDANILEDQIEALQVASTLIMAVLQLGGTRSSSGTTSSIIPSSNRFAEAVVNQLKKAICDLKCSQPKETKRRGPALKRAKTHTAITEFLDTLLLVAKPVKPKDEPSGDNSEEKEKSKSKDKTSDNAPEDHHLAILEHFNTDPKEDGMPEHLRHNPDNVYARVHVNDVDIRSLNFYGLPFSKAKENPNFYIIWRPMEVWECENLFQHTKKIRINEQHVTIEPKNVIKSLLRKWMGVETSDASTDDDAESNPDFVELDKNLEELKAQDERRRSYERPIIRERSWSPPPASRERLPVPRRLPRYRGDRLGITSKTEYWRSWGGQTATLNNSLKFAGWQPVYMRGTDAGQTWFYGPDVIHVRRFTEEYTPQDGATKAEKDAAEVKEYLIISSEWIEEEALLRHGFQFQLLASGHYSLDARLTWGDIELLVYASSTFHEERLYRKFRNAAKGDLFEPKTIAIPDADYLNGSSIVERIWNKKPAPAGRHTSHKLESMPEEPAESVFAKKQEVVTPSVESHDSFVEVST